MVKPGDLVGAVASIEIGPTDSVSWTCQACSFKNLSESFQCGICFTTRLSAPAVRRISQNEESGQVTSVMDKLRSYATADYVGTMSEGAKSDASWNCLICKFVGNLKSSHCQVCGYKNGSCDSGKGEPLMAPYEEPIMLPIKQDGKQLRSTQEFDAVQEYDAIVASCWRRGEVFVDSSFSPLLDQDNPNTNWRRPEEIATFFDSSQLKWTVYNPTIPSVIKQGALGNCWFLSALSVIAARLDILERVILTKEFCEQGVYMIRLCINGRWRFVVVDDLFPCTPHNQMKYSKAERKQLWVSLVEKSLAKVYGSYEALPAGWTGEGLAILTGAPCETILLQEQECTAKVSYHDVVWTKLRRMKEANFLMGAACSCQTEDLKKECSEMGLLPSHAYSLLDVQEVDGKRLVKCRNPWGNFPWKGDWSGDSKRWTEKLLADLIPEGFDKGVFWMPYNDFCRYFYSVDVCRYRKNWQDVRLEGFLLPHCKRNYVHLAQLEVNEATEVDVSVYQPNTRNDNKRSLLDLSLMIFPIDELERPTALKARSDHNTSTSVFVSTDLQPGRYIVIWTAFNHWGTPLADQEIPKCVVAVQSARTVSVNMRLTSPLDLADCFIQTCLSDGETKSSGIPGVAVYRLRGKRWLGDAIMVENTSADSLLQFRCDCSGSKNMVSTRGAFVTTDTIAPQHRQVVMILTIGNTFESSTLCYQSEYKLLSTKDHCHSHEPELTADIYGLHAPRPIP